MNDTTIFAERPALIPATTPATTTSGTLRAPLYVAWQITNECNLACLHCIEESGPGKAFPDELNREQTFDVLRQIIDDQVPYLSFSGGEPMLHPHFFDMVQYVCERGAELKIETNVFRASQRLQLKREPGPAGPRVQADGEDAACCRRAD